MKGTKQMQDESTSLTFEEAFGELQSSIEELRGDALTLDRSLALYERGIALAAQCNTLLTNAELRITQTTVGFVADRNAGGEADW
jgi:exodeoxyribonuclease VII small subunit